MIMAASALESGPQLRPGSPHSPSIIVENIITNIIIKHHCCKHYRKHYCKPYLCKHYEQELPKCPTIIIVNTSSYYNFQPGIDSYIDYDCDDVLGGGGDDYNHSYDCGNRRCEQSHSYNYNFYLFLWL